MDIQYPCVEFRSSDKGDTSIDAALQASTPSHERPYVVYSPRPIRPSWARYFANASAVYRRSHDHLSASLADAISDRICRCLTDPRKRHDAGPGIKVSQRHGPGMHAEPASVAAALATLSDQLEAVPPERRGHSFKPVLRAVKGLQKRMTANE